MKLKKYLKSDWRELLSDEFSKDYFCQLESFLSTQEECIVYPPKEEIFSAFNLTPFKNTKVIIMGQDPYHGEGQAHGLSFSVKMGIPLPPSLKNIYKELSDDLNIITVNHGNLEYWAQQGVLLLNNVLTVEKSKAASHRQKGWELFTDKTIELLNTQKNNLVFILWGSPAQKKCKFIDNSRHLVLQSVHPSPLSAYRGFFGSRPFSRSNTYLINNSHKPIDWRLGN